MPRELTPAEDVLLARFSRLLQQLRSVSQLQVNDMRGRGEDLEELAQIHAGELQIAIDELADIASDVRAALEDVHARDQE